MFIRVEIDLVRPVSLITMMLPQPFEDGFQEMLNERLPLKRAEKIVS